MDYPPSAYVYQIKGHHSHKELRKEIAMKIVQDIEDVEDGIFEWSEDLDHNEDFMEVMYKLKKIKNLLIVKYHLPYHVENSDRYEEHLGEE